MHLRPGALELIKEMIRLHPGVINNTSVYTVCPGAPKNAEPGIMALGGRETGFGRPESMLAKTFAELAGACFASGS